MPTSLNSYIFAEMEPYGIFDKIQGGECTENVTDYVAGGERQARKIKGTFSYADITLSRAWDFSRDRGVIEWAKRNIVQGIPDSKTVVKYTKNAQGIIEGQSSYKVVPKSYKTPDGVAGDDGIAEFTITLAVEREL
jgi:hypothetical protein